MALYDSVYSTVHIIAHKITTYIVILYAVLIYMPFHSDEGVYFLGAKNTIANKRNILTVKKNGLKNAITSW